VFGSVYTLQTVFRHLFYMYERNEWLTIILHVCSVHNYFLVFLMFFFYFFADCQFSGTNSRNMVINTLFKNSWCKYFTFYFLHALYPSFDLYAPRAPFPSPPTAVPPTADGLTVGQLGSSLTVRQHGPTGLPVLRKQGESAEPPGNKSTPNYVHCHTSTGR
jgi:hypothetical protein